MPTVSSAREAVYRASMLSTHEKRDLRDLALYRALDTHGPLPSHYLYEFTKDIARDRFGLLDRLRYLTEAGFLARPRQLNHPLVFSDFKVYELTEKSAARIREGRKLALGAGGGYRHALMAGCITANIEIGAARAGFRFIPQKEILGRAPQATREAKNPLALRSSIEWEFVRSSGSRYVHRSDRPAIPDNLFGIDYGSGARFFALEADRGTEPMTRPNLASNSILRKLLSYRSILSTGEYKAQLGIPNLFPMFITTSSERARNMLNLGRQVFSNGSSFVLFKYADAFGALDRTPPLQPGIFSESFVRTGGPFCIARI